MADINKAQLIFLDAIQRASSDTADQIKALKEAIMGVLAAVAEANSKGMMAMVDSIKTIPVSRVKNVVDMVPIADSVKKLEEINAAAGRSLSAELDKHYRTVAAILSRLEAALIAPKKYKVNIDRNHQTKLIQDVTIEQIKE
jgi:hypothetical protein